MSWLWAIVGFLVGMVWCKLTRPKQEEYFDPHYPNSSPPNCGLDCPDTQPTAPGALDSDLGRLK